MVDKKNQTAAIEAFPASTDFSELLRRSLLALVVCAVVVVISYLWVDPNGVLCP
jgi:hypothetical protein